MPRVWQKCRDAPSLQCDGDGVSARTAYLAPDGFVDELADAGLKIVVADNRPEHPLLGCPVDRADLGFPRGRHWA